MGIGIFNPCGFQCGGGPTLPEKVWRQLRQGLGEDGPGPEDGLEDRWRQCRALMIAKAMSLQETAFAQAFPQLGVDHAPVYEAILALPTQPTLAEQTDAIVAAYTLELDATIAGLKDELKAIEPVIEIDLIAPEVSIVTRHGKPFQVDAAPQDASGWPAYSQHFFLHVRWPLAGPPPDDKKRLVERSLSRSLPSWVDWTIYNQAGFYLDGYNDSYLDVTAMGG